MTVISFPVPAYSNVPIQPQNYQPRQFFIENVALGIRTLVTTTADTDFVVGQLIRLIIPPQFGCTQLNEVLGYVLAMPTPSQLYLDIDSSQNVDPFQSSSASTQPQVLPVGDINTGATNNNGRMNNGTFIPGSFKNVSPSEE